MPRLTDVRSGIARTAHRREIELRRATGLEVKRLREDVGLSQGRLARAAGISQSLLSRIEAGDVTGSLTALTRVSAALGGRLTVRIDPGVGPAVRDHIQAAMLQGLLAALHPRWRRFVDVPVYRPVRGDRPGP